MSIELMTDIKRTANKIRAKLKGEYRVDDWYKKRTANKVRAKLKGEYRVDDWYN